MTVDDFGWENLGDTISEIVDSAVNSHDFRKLNQTVTRAVNKAVNSSNEAFRAASEAANAYARKTAYQPNKNMYSSKLGSQTNHSVMERKEKLPILYRSTNGKMVGGILKTVWGGILTAASSVGALVTAIACSVLPTGLLYGMCGVLGLGACGGIWLLNSGIRTIGRVNRFEKYVKALGQKTYCTLDKLARIVGKPTKFVRKELRSMIDQGYFLEGHLDQEEKNLITSDETYLHYQQSQQQYQQRMQEEKEKRAPTDANQSQIQEVLDRGNSFIREIRRCNDRIPGEEISGKIDRMEMIVRKIFDRAQAHPEIIPDLKKMMDYYLPMTVKLLNAYADMDEQPVQGMTIQSSKAEIEATLDTLNQAFEKLLDSVFKDTAMDVSSDISVLNTLLAQEGLTEDDISGRKNK